MDKIGILEARNKFSALVERAENGEDVIITRHGRPVAKLVAVNAEVERAGRRQAAAKIRQMRENIAPDALRGTSVRAMIDEGRR